MFISLSLTPIVIIGSICALGSLILKHCADKLNTAGRTHAAIDALCASTALAGFSWACLILAIISHLRQI